MEINYLEDLDVKWVSLVDHGANRIPFKIVKSEDRMGDVIQSIILSKNISLDDVKQSVPWLNGVEITKEENYQDYNKFIHRPMDKFDSDTMRLIKVDESVLALVGEMANPDEKATIYKSVMDKPIGFNSDSYLTTFRESFYKELNNLVSFVGGALELSDMDNKRKKSVVSNALDAFKTFVFAGLDHGTDPIFFKSEEQIDEVVMEDVKKNDVVQVDNSTSEIASLLKALIEKVDAIGTPAPVEPEPQADPTRELVTKFDESISAISKRVDELVEKVNSLDSDIPESGSTTEPIEKAEASFDEKNPYVGVIFGR